MYRTVPRSVAPSRPTSLLTNNLLYGLLVVLALAMPFELVQPLLSTGGVRWTNLELLVAGTMLMWGIHLFGVASDSRTSGFTMGRALWGLAVPGAIFLVLATISAIAAPVNSLGALKVVTRLAMGLYAFALTISVVDRTERLEGLLWAIVAGAGVSALLGWTEALGWSVWTPFLALFKEAPSRVGGELRVSGSFQYATVAAMFFEATIPVALALSATARTATARNLALLVAVLGCTLVVMTLTRTGLVTLLVLLLGMLAIGARARHLSTLRGLLRPVGVALAALVLATGVLAWQSSAFRTRLTTENDLNWYGATYEAPASLELEHGVEQSVTIVVRNTGEATWKTDGQNPFVLGYRWLSDDGETSFGGSHAEVPLPRDVGPGESIALQVPLDPSLPPGAYQLEWSMLQQDILWFSDRNVPAAQTQVTLTGRAEETTTVPPVETRPSANAGPQPTFPPTVGRRDLWRAALLMWQERPLLGVGPGNFRHLYGRYLGMADWDDRIYANNLYIEYLTTLGVLGVAAFGWIVLSVARQAVSTFQRPPDEAVGVWIVGLGAALCAFLLHGLLDYFLEVVSLYLLFWITLGLIVAARRLPREAGPD